jgi:hypothetical protein
MTVGFLKISGSEKRTQLLFRKKQKTKDKVKLGCLILKGMLLGGNHLAGLPHINKEPHTTVRVRST